MKQKLLHISHFDLDGVIPHAITSLLCDLCNKYELMTLEIHPKDLLNTLGKVSSGEIDFKPDIILITDLACPQPVIKFLWESGLMRVTCVMDHHIVKYDPIEYSKSPEIMEIRKNIGGEKYTEIDPADHIFIRTETEINRVDGTPIMQQQCGTNIYIDLLMDEQFADIFDYATSANSMVVRNEDDKALYKMDIEKLHYLGKIVRLYDTFDFKKNPESYDSVDARRLNVFFQNIDRKTFMSYIASYVMTPEVTWGQLTFDNAIFPVATVINPIIVKDDKYIERKAIQFATTSWRPKYLNPETKQIYDYGRELTIAVILADRLYGFIAEKCLTDNEGIDAVAVITYENVSLYCRKGDPNVNVGNIAIAFGGGGHQSASGFPIDIHNSQWMMRNFFTGTVNLASGLCKSEKRGEDTVEVYG